MNTWEFGVVVTWFIAASVFITLLLGILYQCAKAYVNDAETPNPILPVFPPTPKYSCDMSPSAGIMFAILFGGLIGGIAWFITWPALAVYGFLRALRFLVRFKKTYQKHKHDPESGEVVNG